MQYMWCKLVLILNKIVCATCSSMPDVRNQLSNGQNDLHNGLKHPLYVEDYPLLGKSSSTPDTCTYTKSDMSIESGMRTVKAYLFQTPSLLKGYL